MSAEHPLPLCMRRESLLLQTFHQVCTQDPPRSSQRGNKGRACSLKPRRCVTITATQEEEEEEKECVGEYERWLLSSHIQTRGVDRRRLAAPLGSSRPLSFP